MRNILYEIRASFYAYNFDIEIDPWVIGSVYNATIISKSHLIYYTKKHMEYLHLLHDRILTDVRDNGDSCFRLYFSEIPRAIPVVEQWLRQVMSPEEYQRICNLPCFPDKEEGPIARVAYHYYHYVEKKLIKTTEPERLITYV